MIYLSDFLKDRMAQRFTFGVLSSAFLLGLALIIQSFWLPCTESDLHLTFKYGVGAKNVLNTFTGTYTRDMVKDPPVTVKFCLSEKDLDRIYQKMVAIDFFSYPTRFSAQSSGDVIGEMTPFSTYYFKVQCGSSETKELVWAAKYTYSGNKEAEDLKELIDLIIEIIRSKPEYRRLPEPRAGYA